jgi:hypothetical protein
MAVRLSQALGKATFAIVDDTRDPQAGRPDLRPLFVTVVLSSGRAIDDRR